MQNYTCSQPIKQIRLSSHGNKAFHCNPAPQLNEAQLRHINHCIKLNQLYNSERRQRHLVQIQNFCTYVIFPLSFINFSHFNHKSTLFIPLFIFIPYSFLSFSQHFHLYGSSNYSSTNFITLAQLYKVSASHELIRERRSLDLYYIQSP